MKIVLATSNPGKVREIKEILSEHEIVSMKEEGFTQDIIEDGKTFEENALIKARAIHKATGLPTLADDSGYQIEEYNGWPGVETARMLGPDKATNDFSEERNEYILNKMKGLPKERRKAKHVTCIAYIDKNGNEVITLGEENGYIAEFPRGKNGFAFDPIFELEDGRTSAELTKEEKNSISSRRRALEKMKNYIKEN